jgi:hypothetical protein
MKWTLLNGKEVSHSDSKYRIDFTQQAPSKGAQAVKDFIKESASLYVWFEEYRLPAMLLRVDFLCPSKKIAIEFNGSQHTKFNKHFFKYRSAFGKQIKNDMKKIEFLQHNGYTVIELEDSDLPLTKEFFKENYKITF